MRKRLILLSLALLIAASAFAEALPTLSLNDLSSHDRELSLELSWSEEMLQESDAWKQSAQRLEESTYAWIAEAKGLLARYFQDACGESIDEKLASIEVYVSDLPEFIAGFHGGAGDVYINRIDLERKHILNICLHEMIHALGFDFYEDENGMLSNAFYEGCAEALAGKILAGYGYDYADFSSYDALVECVQVFLECDGTFLTDIAVKEQHDIAGRIDRILEPGAGKQLLTALTLLGSGSEDSDVTENISIILKACENALK